MIITQNGEAKVVIQDIANYEKTQDQLAMLKIIALGNRQIDQGEIYPAAEVIARLKSEHLG